MFYTLDRHAPYLFIAVKRLRIGVMCPWPFETAFRPFCSAKAAVRYRHMHITTKPYFDRTTEIIESLIYFLTFRYYQKMMPPRHKTKSCGERNFCNNLFHFCLSGFSCILRRYKPPFISRHFIHNDTPLVLYDPN